MRESEQKSVAEHLFPWYTNIVAGDTAKKYRGVERL